jgi:glycosyltransferase involved in cell wall biosynthesis
VATTSRQFDKLVIQIPCLNEAGSLPISLAALPRKMEGFRKIEWLIIDDGSTDDTVEVARRHGVDHVVSLGHNQGLAKAFMAGLEASLKAGADVIVNTDADNQYIASYIPDLVRPILVGSALMVVGARPIADIEEFGPVKKVLQRLGSWVVERASGAKVLDAPSGFRAIHRDAALRLNVFNNYTYTLETLIQAGRNNIPTAWVPVAVNKSIRPSRLVGSIPSYLYRSVLTIIRIFIIYKPLKFFSVLAAMTAFPGILVTIRFLIYFSLGEGEGHTQSLVLGSALLALSGTLAMGGLVADLIATNRVLLEDIRARALRFEIERHPSRSEEKV